MKFSTKSRYGLRAILRLASNYGREPLSAKSIAENEEISEAYLEQLLALMGKAGLLKSVRGAQGGYLMVEDPGKVHVGDVIRVLEGPIAPVDCVHPKNPSACHRSDKCVSRMVWERVRNAVDDVLDSITLQDLCDELERIEGNDENYMFYI